MAVKEWEDRVGGNSVLKLRSFELWLRRLSDRGFEVEVVGRKSEAKHEHIIANREKAEKTAYKIARSMLLFDINDLNDTERLAELCNTKTPQPRIRLRSDLK